MALRTVRAVIAGFALSLCAACDVPQELQPSLEIGVVIPTTHLDPARGDEPGTALIARFAFQTLPQISRKIVHGPDPRTWTFTLKHGLHFSDGTQLDAEAVEANFSRWETRLSGFPVYARTFRPGSPHAIRGGMQRGTWIVVIDTRGPFPNLVEVLADPHFSLGSPKAIADDAAFDRRPVGSGGYEVETFVPGRYARLVPVLGRPRLQYASVRIDDMPDPHTAILSLDKNDVSVVYGFPERYLDEARAGQMNPVEEPATGRWCAFATGLVKRDRVCPPGESVAKPRAERSTP